ncbi:hypothetical protein GCWU000246_01135 [Jonquetella anthropi E3_33 E1]|nr:hypothetical protein GCWU000246_01135 [Jonquetella anthropi E3_33 E1]
MLPPDWGREEDLRLLGLVATHRPQIFVETDVLYLILKDDDASNMECSIAFNQKAGRGNLPALR